MNILMYQSLIFQLTHHFLISIPIPSTNLFFPVDTSVQPDLNPNTINQSIFLAGISVQPDLNPDPINQGPADVSNDNFIGTPSNNLSCFASA